MASPELCPQSGTLTFLESHPSRLLWRPTPSEDTSSRKREEDGTGPGPPLSPSTCETSSPKTHAFSCLVVEKGRDSPHRDAGTWSKERQRFYWQRGLNRVLTEEFNSCTPQPLCRKQQLSSLNICLTHNARCLKSRARVGWALPLPDNYLV